MTGVQTCALPICQRAIHRAGVHVNITERLGDELGVGALAARTRAVQSNDNGIFRFQNKFSVPL